MSYEMVGSAYLRLYDFQSNLRTLFSRRFYAIRERNENFILMDNIVEDSVHRVLIEDENNVQ